VKPFPHADAVGRELARDRGLRLALGGEQHHACAAVQARLTPLMAGNRLEFPLLLSRESKPRGPHRKGGWVDAAHRTETLRVLH